MRRPWNIINLPIYSLQTVDKDGKLNMNICTYVSVVSMKPKIYSVAVYYGTKTFENLENSENVVLQILSKDNIGLVKNLGKKSGLKINKDKYLRKQNLIKWKEYEVLDNSCALIELKKSDCIKNHGDHAIYLFDLVSSKTINETNILTFHDLVEQKIIL
ncbi:MAG: flavin reductase [Flavobacteriales bacterium]|mgnify:FL=1